MTSLQLIHAKRLTDASDSGTGLELGWLGGEQFVLASRTLRRNCPCATCQEKRGDTSHKAPLRPSGPGKSLLTIVDATVSEAENLIRVWPIGNYALGLLWGDKHDSGIFPYDLLYRLPREGAKSES